MSKSDAFDVVIIGGGHNGLTCAGYLARAGLRVKVVERRHIVGGAAVTEEFHPGFRNSVASYTVSLLNPRVIEDLELHTHGLRLVERVISNFWPLDDERYLRLPFGIEEVQQEFARFSEHDAQIAPRYFEAVARIGEVLRGLVLQTPPNAGGGWPEAFRALRMGHSIRGITLEDQRLLLDLFTKSTCDFLEGWFESPEVCAAFAFDGTIGSFSSPHTPGSAYVLLHHAFGEVNGKRGVWGHAIGGMGAITQAMARSAEAHGVDIELEAPVAEVLTRDGRACGVRLEDGRRVEARVVASNLNPRLLFTKLVDPALLDADFYRRITHYKCGSGTFRMNVALSELPQFTCRPADGVADHHSAGIVVAPSVEYLDRAYTDARAFGWSREPIVEMLIPSTLDDTLAPPGKHVASLFCQQFSPELPDGSSWDEHADTCADLIIDTVTRYAPNFRSSVLGRQVLSPLDLERVFGLTAGDIFHGALTLDQMFSARPVLGHGDYRSPVPGLYMCGSGTHPGGGVTGAPGHNAAREILRDFRRRRVPRTA